MGSREIPISFLCGGDRLLGILHRPDVPSARGLLVVHGRPATRVGKHRLFVLLARTWAEAGVPVLRFDYRGTGDSEGRLRTFEETGIDIHSAVDAFISNLPGLQEVVLWGLCGGAADALSYAPKDKRISGTILVNPWTYDARVRALARARGFVSSWLHRFQRLATGEVRSAERSDLNISRMLSGRCGTAEAPGIPQSDDLDLITTRDQLVVDGTRDAVMAYRSYRAADLSKRLAISLEKFSGRVLLILGGGDIGAQTFKYTASLSFKWRRLLSAKRVKVLELPGANHSLKRPEWRDQAASWTLDWLNEF